MKTKHILGLDIGTNSIGWAVLNAVENEGITFLTGIHSSGVRCIPMDEKVLGNFEKGNSVSQTAERTKYRSIRRLYERSHLRRMRLHRVLSILKFLPAHYEQQLDRYGRFVNFSEPKLAWTRNEHGTPQFLFQDSFNEMLADFRLHQPELVANNKKVPYDWTIYYLRKKALTQKITKEELAWLLLSFNQKRGYYQLREETESEQKSAKKEEYFDSQVVTDIIDSGEVYKGLKIFIVVLANGTRGKVFMKEKPDWIGFKKDVIATVELDKNGKERKDENGVTCCRFKVPTEKEWEEKWALIKAKTQNDLDNSGKTVGAYIYDTLLQLPKQKIRGKLVRTIERKYYKNELCQILKKQGEFHPELKSQTLYNACIEELYPNNESHRNLIAKRDMCYLLVEDILFYQRPLKSKKSLIANCPYENYSYQDENGEIVSVPVKCIPKSHPLFQEFRLWHFLRSLRIYKKEAIVDGRLKSDVDVTEDFLKNDNDYVALFDWLNNKKKIKQETLLKYKPWRLIKKEWTEYRWNYVEDKEYPCNETRSQILERLEKTGISTDFLTNKIEEDLWHILYSISDKNELKSALRKFAVKNNLQQDSFVEAFKDMPPFKKDYGAYSARALKKLLPLMRMGKYWNADAIDIGTRERIEKILSGEHDENITMQVREKARNLQDISSFRGLPAWLACYIVYGRHSEASEVCTWKTPSEIDDFLAHFKQNSLRNPIVEQVVLETLRVVRDIWKQVGNIDEIHVELARSMKRTNEERAKTMKQIQENENANLKIRALLTEFSIHSELNIENVRPYSPSHQRRMRIYENYVWDNVSEDDPNVEAMLEIRRKLGVNSKGPSSSEIQRYKCWLEQKYCSPYTGRVIPLNKLFTDAYQVDHIIPKERYYDDSFSNKVICEAEVNQLKGSQLGYEFICNNPNRIVQLGDKKTVNIFSVAKYEEFVKDHYSGNRKKMKKLLMNEIPDDFVARQLNDTRYISKLIKSLLSNIVREADEQEDVSKNVIVSTGAVTDRLKNDWGLDDVWNKIIINRFKRMNLLTGTMCYTVYNTNNRLIPNVPIDQLKGFSKKRIDHRHHAMDAIVIACTSRNIINYLNNESARSGSQISRYDLRHLLCEKDKKGNYRFKKPWNTFTQDAYHMLLNIVVSFKQKLRVIKKSSNKHQSENCDNVNRNWTVCKQLHTETYFGKINLRKTKSVSLNEAIKNPVLIVDKDLKKIILRLLAQGLNIKQIKKYFDENKEIWQDVDLKKINVYYFSQDSFASRVPIDMSFDKDTIENKLSDTGIIKILSRHLELCGGDPNCAFSPDGIEQLNNNIVDLNNGKFHQPIYKVRKYEEATGKFPVGKRGNKGSKYVEAAKGTNLFFAVYETSQEDKQTGLMVVKRSFMTIPLNVAVNRLKQGLSPAPENKNGDRPKFVLSPYDLVYVPTKQELESGNIAMPLDINRIYKMVSCTGNEGYFIPFYVAQPIKDTVELGSNNKAQRAWTGEMIKEVCLPLSVDRLGNISLLL